MKLATLNIRSHSAALFSFHRSAGKFKLLITLIFLTTALIGSAANRYSVASGNWNSTSTWSASSNGTAGASVPVAGDVVYIERGKNVTVTVNAECSAINFTTTTATTLTINSGITLTVSGTVTIPRSTSGINVLAVGAGTLNAASIAFTSGGGTKRHEVTISTGTVNVSGDVTQTGSTGSATFTFTGAGNLNLGGAIFADTEGTIVTATGCTVAYNGSVAQTIQVYSYVNLTASGTNTKTLAANTSITGILTVNSGSTLAFSTFTLGGATGLVMECGGSSASTISGTGQLTLAGNVTVNDDGLGTQGATISTPIALGANRTFTVADDGSSANDLTISSVISGSFTLTKAGAGQMVLSGANTYTGSTTISAGTLKLGASSSASTSGPLGTTAGGTTVSSGAALDLSGFSFTSSATEALSLSGTGVGGLGALTNSSATTSTYIGVITFTAAASIVGEAGLIAITGTPASGTTAITLGGTTGGSISTVIAGARTLTKEGSGTWTLTAANTYSGATTISSGKIKLNPSANVTPATQYIMNGGDLSTEGITSNRTITSSKTLRLDLSSDIILGTNVHTLTFAASNGETWASNQMLTITGWAGSYNGTAGTAGKIFFGNSASGLTTQQLSKIQFFNGTSYFPAMLLSTGQLVPYALSITTGTITGSPFCEGESSISVPFTYSAASSFSGATFTAQLSNAAGSFTSAVTLQNVTSDNSGSQSINITIPSGTAQGSGYRVRVVSNTPAVTGSDNGSNLTVNALPSAAGTISGSSTVCQGQSSVSYSVGSIANAGSYLWAYSGTGATITGSTSSVTISFSASATPGNLTVQGSNTCGTGTVSANFPISLNELPSAAGAISGSSLVSQGQTNVAYSVGTIANATSYVWGYTGTGATITGNTSSITIYFSGSATSGNVTVKGNNGCGDGASSSFAVTVAGNKTSVADGSWYTPSTWSPSGVPVTTDNVTISKAVTIDNLPTGICNNLTITNTGSLQIYGGLSLTVNGTLTNNAGAYGLTLNSEASLLNNSGTVAATVEKYMANNNKWHFLSSPVANQAIWPEFAPDPGAGLNFGTTWNWDFYYWNPNSSLTTGLYWVNLRKNTAGDYNNSNVDQPGSYAGFGATTPAEFTTGRGYLVSYNNNWNPATGSPEYHYFTGNLHTGAINKAIVTGANNFNLVGNPFASSLDWKASSGWARTDLESNGGGYDYWVYNDNLATGNYGVFNSAGTAGTNGVSRYIAPQQAFFVRAATDGNLGMDFGARAHSSQSFLKTTDSENSFIRLKFSTEANSFSDEMIVEFDPSFSNGGSAKFWSFYTEAPEIFSEKDGNSYSIDRYNNTEEDVVVTLGVKTGVESKYTISATNIGDFTLSSKVILEDLETGTITDLKKTSTYSFNAGVGDNRNRFKLMIGSTIGVNENVSSNFNVYTNDNTVYIINEGSSTSYKATVSNMIGQVVAEKQINGNTSARIQLENVPGVYIVTVQSEGKTFSKKVIIH